MDKKDNDCALRLIDKMIKELKKGKEMIKKRGPVIDDIDTVYKKIKEAIEKNSKEITEYLEKILKKKKKK